MKTKYDFKEIFKLQEMLQKDNIELEFIDSTFKMQDREYTAYQICCPNSDDRYISVIQSHGSYGRDKDLLEIMGLLTDEELEHDGVVGYLTADNVFDRIKNYLEKENG